MFRRWFSPLTGDVCLLLSLAACAGETHIGHKPDEPVTTPTPPPPPPPLAGVIVINEVMPGNQSTLNGPDGTSFPDWIELANISGETVALSDLVLRNSDDERWQGETGQMLAPGERLLIWASDEAIGEGLSTGFSLDKENDKLSLLDTADRVLDFIEFDDLPSDVSVARIPDLSGELTATAWPTPGEINGETASPTLNSADETVFLPYVMHRIDFTFTAAAYNAINNVARPEVHVEVDIDDVHYGDVGLKLKGSASYQDMSGKPAFILDFNEWVEGTKFRGLKALKLHNGLVLDPTRNRDWLSYSLAREAGLMAPRVGWAEVYCNDEYYGLYIVIEKHDDVFIDYRRPEQEGLGAIFEPNESDGGFSWGDFGTGNVNDWNMEEGPVPPDPQLVSALQSADALIGGPATDEHVAALWDYFDREQFITYLAWETMVMHTDGYRAPNNWRVFVDGITFKIELVPSGAEWTWDLGVEPWFYGGQAGSWCLENEGCQREYAARLLELADMVESLSLYDNFVDMQAWLDPYIQSDPRYQTTWQPLNVARSSTGQHLSQNPNDTRNLVTQRYPELAP